MKEKNKISRYHLDIYNSLINEWVRIQKELEEILKKMENNDTHFVSEINKSYELLLKAICIKLNILNKESMVFFKSKIKDSKQLAIELHNEAVGIISRKKKINKAFGIKSEFEKEKDYLIRCEKMENEFNLLLKDLDVKTKPIIIKYFNRFENEISKIKRYPIDLHKYYSEPEHLNVGLTKPELGYTIKNEPFSNHSLFGRMEHELSYRVKLKNGTNKIRIRGYNYFVKIPINHAEENVKNLRAGNFSFCLNFKIRDGNKKIEDILMETLYPDTLNTMSDGRIKMIIPSLYLSFDKFELFDTISKMKFEEFKEGDHHIDRSYKFS
jgi:uncharacterized protein YaaW (UPF0174 family)